MWDDIYNEIDENIAPCKGCGDYDGGECISKGGCAREVKNNECQTDEKTNYF